MYGAHSQTWKNALSALRSWAELHGDVGNLPFGTEVAGIALSPWISKRRVEYRDGLLDPEQIVQLQALPGWSWGASQQERWDSAYNVLVRFTAEHGTAAVHASQVVNGFHLGRWVGQQRATHRRGGLSPKQFMRLEELPAWSWGTSQQERWDSTYAVLRKFAAEHGTADVPGDLAIDGLHLGRWVGQQRATHRRGKLPTHRVESLQALPGWFWTAGRGAASRGVPPPTAPNRVAQPGEN